eukprot:gene11137-biopygen13492
MGKGRKIAGKSYDRIKLQLGVQEVGELLVCKGPLNNSDLKLESKQFSQRGTAEVINSDNAKTFKGTELGGEVHTPSHLVMGSRLKKEYPVSLREMHKIVSNKLQEIRTGDIVLVDDSLKSGEWKEAKAEELIAGKD